MKFLSAVLTAIVFLAGSLILAAPGASADTLDNYTKCIQSMPYQIPRLPDLSLVGGEFGGGYELRDNKLPGHYLFNSEGAYRAPFTVKSEAPEKLVAGDAPVTSRFLHEIIPVQKNGQTKNVDMDTTDYSYIDVSIGQRKTYDTGSVFLNSPGEFAAEAARKGTQVDTLHFADDKNPAYWDRLAVYLADSLDSSPLPRDRGQLAPLTISDYRARLNDNFAECRNIDNPTLNASIDSLEVRLKKFFADGTGGIRLHTSGKSQ